MLWARGLENKQEPLFPFIYGKENKAEGGMLSSCLKAALFQLHCYMMPELFFDKVFYILEESTELQ